MSAITATGGTNRILQYGLYVVMALLTVAMLFAGGMKLAGNKELWQQFVAFGYPYWFYILTGIIEAGAAILLWPRQTRLIGAGLIVATMMGALYSNMMVGASQFYAVNIVVATLAALVGWFNRNSWPLSR
ncbi:MAG: DoxX family protein [Chloroflexota bacterium]